VKMEMGVIGGWELEDGEMEVGSLDFGFLDL
jgi:hypothetical protein